MLWSSLDSYVCPLLQLAPRGVVIPSTAVSASPSVDERTKSKLRLIFWETHPGLHVWNTTLNRARQQDETDNKSCVGHSWLPPSMVSDWYVIYILSILPIFRVLRGLRHKSRLVKRNGSLPRKVVQKQCPEMLSPQPAMVDPKRQRNLERILTFGCRLGEKNVHSWNRTSGSSECVTTTKWFNP